MRKWKRLFVFISDRTSCDYGVFKCSFLRDTIQSDKMLTGPVVLEIVNYV
jgi:hypothetical protein